MLTAAFLRWPFGSRARLVDELTGFARAMRDAALAVPIDDKLQARARYLRHGRKRDVDLQYFDDRGVRSGWRRRPCREAWQSFDIEPVRQRGCRAGEL